ncbi:hypothetical protein OAU50_07220 [Planctomycetota bacterium]|nr:hypothetical protein [Planctomycetota bacterium]
MKTLGLMALALLMSGPLLAQEVGETVPEVKFEASYNMADGVKSTKTLLGKHILYIEAFKIH